MSVGTGIESIRRRQERERMENASRTRKGPRRFFSTQQADSLSINVSGTDYQVLVPGVDNPDDASVARYVP